MAFPIAPGYGNLPNGAFSPQIFSQKVIKFFRKLSIADEITNTEFEGEIGNPGDSVRILKEPQVTVTPYVRGQVVIPQDLNDQDLTMYIDQANSYAFRIDDIEKKQEHVSFEDMAVNSAAYSLKDAYDTDILAYMIANATSVANSVQGTALGTGGVGTEVNVGYVGATFTPLDIVNRLNRLMNENNVPFDGRRFLVASPAFYERLLKEDSKYIEANTMGDSESAIRQAKIGSKPVFGFQMMVSNNLPLNTNGKPILLAGHQMASSTAKNILQSEVLRDPNSFGDLYRGLMVWGRKVIRPEALFVANINLV